MRRRALLLFTVVGLYGMNTAATILNLRRASAQPPGSQVLTYQNTGTVSPLRHVGRGKGYAVDMKFGGQIFTALVDTASSDMWLPKTSFQCVNPRKLAIQFTRLTGEQATCKLGPAYAGTFSDGQIANQHFNISYGSGEYLVGEAGYQDVTLGGITVTNQEVGLADYGFYAAGEDISGIIGFGYPAMTSAFEGVNPGGDMQGINGAPYNPFFFNAAEQGLSCTRGSANVRYNDNAWASTPFRIIPIPAPLRNLVPEALRDMFTFYTIFPEGFLLQGRHYPFSTQGDFNSAVDTKGVDAPMIVDSGTTFTLVPAPIMKGIAAAFDPPAQYNQEEEIYEADCHAAAPELAVRIGGHNFLLDKRDLLIQGENGGLDTQTGLCVLGVQNKPPDGPNVLGDTFLKNVVAVFDVGKKEMRFRSSPPLVNVSFNVSLELLS
ncbi:aspartic peptidase domain-containing [Lecanosticta acicola]|uniref:Aspartic peptidase domain-containing n=1 Tax=Lecanosticta acicola TaxID=111012 RepID=A0AAI9E8H3_9PEZI|nr:aspartic peptidase domain-containing [Lecanosticta acicola]